MAKYRIYNKEITPIGSATADGNIYGLEFPKNSEMGKEYMKVINDFLKKHKLKLVSPYFSRTKHAKSGFNERQIPKLYKTYIRKINPKTKKAELIERK